VRDNLTVDASATQADAGAPPAGCRATTRAGTPCRAFPLPGEPWCLAHHPDRRAEMRAARARGGPAAGRRRALAGRRARLATVPELVAFNARIVDDVLAGRLPVDTARVVVYALTLQRSLVEASDLERRITALEAQRPARGARTQWPA
jgi:hypothetical protein